MKKRTDLLYRLILLGALFFCARACQAAIETSTVAFASDGQHLVGTFYFPSTKKPSPAVIICHVTGDRRTHYAEFGNYLADHGVAAFAFDFYGHGDSEGPRYYVNIDKWVKNIQSAIDVLAGNPRIDKEKIAAFGTSSGGTAILEAALVEPRLKALITSDATVRDIMSSTEKIMLHALTAYGWVKRLLTGKEYRIPMTDFEKQGIPLLSDPKIQEKMMGYLREENVYLPLPGAQQAYFVDTLKRAGRIKQPVLVIWGEEDKLDPPESGRLLYEALTSEKRLEIIPGNGHGGILDRHRDKVMALTLEWVRKYL